MNLENLIKQIKNIIGEDQRLTIEFFSREEICINIYEKEIPVFITKKQKECYIESDFIKKEMLTHEDLVQLSAICGLINENIKMIKGL
jgi:hypothetical protein